MKKISKIIMYLFLILSCTHNIYSLTFEKIQIADSPLHVFSDTTAIAKNVAIKTQQSQKVIMTSPENLSKASTIAPSVDSPVARSIDMSSTDSTAVSSGKIHDGTESSLKFNSSQTNTTSEPSAEQEAPVKTTTPTLQDLSKSQFDFATNLIESTSGKSSILIKQKTLGAQVNSVYPDTLDLIHRTQNLELQARNLAKDGLNDIKYAEMKKGITGRYDKMSSMYRSLNEEKDTQIYQAKTLATLIQSSLDNVTGKDNLSGQSNFKFDPDTQKKLMEQALKENPLLFDATQSDVNRLQAIANINDMVMNELANGDPIYGSFTTTIDPATGHYTTTITKQSEDNCLASSSVTVDNNGVTTQRIFTMDNPDNTTSTFITTIQNGKPKTMFKTYKNDDKALNDEEDIIIEAVHAELKAVQVALLVAKATLWTGKQAAINIASAFIPMHISIAAVTPLVVLVKGGSLLAGYKYSDPIIKTTINAAIELTLGNRKGFISADSNRLFTQGTIGSKITNAIKTGDISGSFAQQRDPHEAYFAVEESIMKGGFDLMQMAFPETFGKQLVSTASLKSETGTSPLNKKQIALNTLGLTSGSSSSIAGILPAAIHA